MKRRVRILHDLLNTVLIGIGMVVLWFIVRIFVFDTFPVNSSSMEPTIRPGDKIVVNKMIFGARLYKNLDFFDGAPMESRRVPGFRPIRHNDVVVFNHCSLCQFRCVRMMERLNNIIFCKICIKKNCS